MGREVADVVPLPVTEPVFARSETEGGRDALGLALILEGVGGGLELGEWLAGAEAETG